MELRELVCDFSYYVIKGSLDTEVTGFTCDSRKICPGWLFVCINGQEHDGHEYVKDALECQAAVLVTERLSDSLLSLYDQESDEFSGNSKLTIVLVADTRKALACISARYYGMPAEKMTIIGITGTKGKTTTAHMLWTILKQAGYACGLIGTNGWTYASSCHSLTHTTPPSWELHEILNKMYEQGCNYVVMEVSSMGIKEQRVYGIKFAYGIYTNLFRDHIGGKEHSNFEEYRYWKQQFFKQCKIGIINKDDIWGRSIAQSMGNDIITYSLVEENASIFARNRLIYKDKNCFGSKFDMVWKQENQVQCETMIVPVAGIGNCSNALAAAACAYLIGISFKEIAEGISGIMIKGRAELICSNEDIGIWIDYAHNGESLEQILKTLREYNPTRLICIFGCGGSRSHERRYSMGRASGTWADLTILTEDNSRDESPQLIIEEIRQGVEASKGDYIIILNREEAISWAIRQACKGDMILLAGKGHEAYQEKNGVRIPFSEHDIVKALWKDKYRSNGQKK